MKRVELYQKVRRAVLIDGMSRRAAARYFGIDRKTIDKMLCFAEPAPHGRSGRTYGRKLAGFTDIIDKILEDDRTVHSKQRHTAARIFERLRDEHGFTGGITIVRDYVAGAKLRSREVFIPLSHKPGHAQVDFGEADGIIDGKLVRFHYFCMDLPHSDAPFFKAYPAEVAEAFAKAMLRLSPSSAAFRSRSCTTTPNWRWRRYWATVSASAVGCSRPCRAIICSKTSLVAPARAMTKARLKGSSDMSADTSWCRCR
jgi:hypothetical protein